MRAGESRLWSAAVQRPARLAALVAALAYLPWLSAAPVRGSLEANRLIAAREMLARGDWVLPTLNGEPYLAKPPFQYWLIEGVAGLTGMDVLLAGRAISALAVVALAAIVAAFGRRTVSGAVGLIAGLGVAAAGIVLEKGVIAELETVLAAAAAAAAFSFYLGVIDDRRRSLWVFLGGLSVGAALLTKGPVVLVFLLPAVLAFLVVARGARLRSLLVFLGQLAIGLAAALPWVFLLARRIGWDRAAGTFRSEAVARVQHAGASNAAPWWFYGPGLVGALGPLVLGLPFLALRAWREEPRRRRTLFLLGWALLPVLLLSFSAGKETRYLIAAIPAWSLLLAEGFEIARSGGELLAYRRVLRRVAIGVSWVGPVIVVATSFSLTGDPRIAALVAGGFLLAARVLAALPGSATAWRSGLAALLALLGIKVFWAHAYLGGARARQPVIEAGRRIAAQVPPDREITVPVYDAVVHLAVDRPLRIVPDLAALEPDSKAIALVAPGIAVGAGWVEMDRVQLGSQTYRLLRQQPASVRREP